MLKDVEERDQVVVIVGNGQFVREPAWTDRETGALLGDRTGGGIVLDGIDLPKAGEQAEIAATAAAGL